MTDRDSVREFLAAPRCAVLSTLDAHGAPHQTVLHYFLEEDGLVVNGRPDRLWAKNLRRDPRVSVVVHDSDKDPEEFRHLQRVSFAVEPRRVFESLD